jgi:hypothetical protein
MQSEKAIQEFPASEGWILKIKLNDETYYPFESDKELQAQWGNPKITKRGWTTEITTNSDLTKVLEIVSILNTTTNQSFANFDYERTWMQCVTTGSAFGSLPNGKWLIQFNSTHLT